MGALMPAGAQAKDPPMPWASPSVRVVSATLPEVTVSATRIEQSTSDVPATISVIDARQIDRALTQDIVDLIRYDPGIGVRRDPARSGAQAYNIRGLDDNRVLIRIDGIRTPDFFSFGPGGFNFATRNLVDLESLKAVEILRGPASSLYGSDALGGVVTYLTKDPSDYLIGGRTTFFSAKAAYASEDEANLATLTGAAAFGPLQTLVVVTRRRGHEVETQGTNDATGPARTVANPQTVDGDNLLAKLVYVVDPTQRWRLTGEYLESRVLTDVLSLNATTPRTSALTGDDLARRSRVSLDYAYAAQRLGGLAGASAQVYWQSSDAQARTNEIRTATGATCSGSAVGNNTCFIPRTFSYDTETFGGELQLAQRFEWGGAAHRLVYGVELVRTETAELRNAAIVNQTRGTVSNTLAGDRFPVRDFPESTTLTTGVYVQDEMLFVDGRLVITPGVRYDHYRLSVHPDAIYNANTPPGVEARDFSDGATSPKIAASWRLNPRDVVYAQYAFGFRIPPFTELNAAFRNPIQSYTLIPNPDLVSEKSRGLEIGVKGDGTNLRYALAAFWNRYRDFIDPTVALACPADPRCVPGFATTFQAINRGRVTIRGAEAKVEWSFARDWTLLASAAYAKGNDDDRDTPINSILPPTGVVGLRYAAPDQRWGATTIVTGVAGKKDIDTSAGPLFASPGFGLVDLTAWWTFAPGATVNAGVFNVFDRKYFLWADLYRTALSPTSPALDRYTQPGRHVGVSLSLAI